MTIEIRELVIRAVAEARPGDPRAATASPIASPEPSAALTGAANLDPLDREALVARVVREVLRELKKSRER